MTKMWDYWNVYDHLQHVQYSKTEHWNLFENKKHIFEFYSKL